MAEEKLEYAKNFRCCRCGKNAEVFWPMVDPDIPHRPYCRPCVEKAKQEVMLELGKIKFKKT